ALPGATILSLDDGHVRPVAWDDLDHVRVTRQFLNDPEAFLRHL
nr:ABC transporter ATP-binding protein [Chloroflexia bacterium]